MLHREWKDILRSCEHGAAASAHAAMLEDRSLL